MNGLFWREPFVLLLIFVPLLFVFIIKLKQKKQWLALVDSHLLPWVKVAQGRKNSGLKKVLLVLAWCLLCIALAGPRSISWIPPELNKQTSENIVIIDFSQSMYARDIKPNRLHYAFQLLKRFSQQLPPKTKLGLLVYSGQAHWVIKPTHDHDLFNYFVKQLPKIKLPTLGNNLTQAINKTIKTWDNNLSHKNIVLLTDGDFEQQAKTNSAKLIETQLINNNIGLTVIGIGQSELVNIPSFNNQYLMENGQRVVSRKETAWLQKIKGVRYYDAEQLDNKNLVSLLNLPKANFSKKDKDKIIWNEWFFIPLLLSFVTLLLLTVTKKGTRE